MLCERQATARTSTDQLANSNRDDEFDRLSVGGPYLEDAVTISSSDGLDRANGPALEVVCRFPCVDSIVNHV